MVLRDGDFNAHVLNNILAVHPVSRYLTSLLYLSEINGLSNIYYKDSSLLDGIQIDNLDLLDIEGLDQKSRADLERLAAEPNPRLIPDERQPAGRPPARSNCSTTSGSTTGAARSLETTCPSLAPASAPARRCPTSSRP
jgi:hypothetical protein